MLDNLKICIVFNSGACGDFLAQLIYSQFNNNDITIEDTGAATNFLSEDFKTACQLYYENNFDETYFNSVDKDIIIGNTHYCYKQLIDLFPKCQFYYIDDSNHIDTTIKYYTKKRLSNDPLGYIEIKSPLRNTNLKDKNIPRDLILQIMTSEWKSQLLSWENLGMKSVPLEHVVDKTYCRLFIKSIVKSIYNEDVFNTMFDKWADKNIELIQLVLTKNYAKL